MQSYIAKLPWCWINVKNCSKNHSTHSLTVRWYTKGIKFWKVPLPIGCVESNISALKKKPTSVLYIRTSQEKGLAVHSPLSDVLLLFLLHARLLLTWWSISDTNANPCNLQWLWYIVLYRARLSDALPLVHHWCGCRMSMTFNCLLMEMLHFNR